MSRLPACSGVPLSAYVVRRIPGDARAIAAGLWYAPRQSGGETWWHGQRHVEVERLLTPAEVAQLFKVHPLTVTRWAVQGRIGSGRTLGGHTRYKEAEVLRLLHRGTHEAEPSVSDQS